MAFKHRHFLGLEELTAEDISHILEQAESLQEISLREI
ncbi:MAG: aspartate carbamoyltransferase, partial [Deltaproteobacteria bacterium]|nr:aspartate carbamoyltransferase [Deltaproteobacteria bacterium]